MFYQSIRIIVFISCFFIFSSFADGSSDAKKRDKYLGVVFIYVVTPDSLTHGSAVFISPDTLVTALHVIRKVKDPMENYLYFNDSKTGEPIFISSVLHLDIENDLAVLKVKNYQSEVFYSIKESPVVPSYAIDSSNDVVLAGFSLRHFFAVTGRMISYDFDMTIVFDNYPNSLLGMSGGAIFHEDTKELVGILLERASLSMHGEAKPIRKVKKLLSQKPLSCSFTDCLKNELERLISRAKKGSATALYAVFNWLKAEGKEQSAFSLLILSIEQKNF